MKPHNLQNSSKPCPKSVPTTTTSFSRKYKKTTFDKQKLGGAGGV